jgi:hypothetical protein
LEEVAEGAAEEAMDDGALRVDAALADLKEDETRDDESDAEEASADVDEAFTDESLQSLEAQQQLEH